MGDCVALGSRQASGLRATERGTPTKRARTRTRFPVRRPCTSLPARFSPSASPSRAPGSRSRAPASTLPDAPVRVARRHGAALAERGLQLRELVQRRVATRVLVAFDARPIVELNRYELIAEATGVLRRNGAPVTLEGVRVLLLARNAVTRGN